jgi:hypothetical protein
MLMTSTCYNHQVCSMYYYLLCTISACVRRDCSFNRSVRINLVIQSMQPSFAAGGVLLGNTSPAPTADRNIQKHDVSGTTTTCPLSPVSSARMPTNSIMKKRDVRAMYSLPKHSKLPFLSTYTTDPDSDTYDSDNDCVSLPIPIPSVADFHRLSHSAFSLATTLSSEQLPSEPGQSSTETPISDPLLQIHPGTSSNATMISIRTLKRRKQNAHNRCEKEAAEEKLKQWQDANKMKTKYCHVCKTTKSMSKFYRVRSRGHDCASGRCVACKNFPAV